LRQAATLLGISKDAVRQRIRRGTLRSGKGEDGRVYVYLDASFSEVHVHPAA
jgi:DNA-directed RNA polymerase specialized sigma24 family protein